PTTPAAGWPPAGTVRAGTLPRSPSRSGRRRRTYGATRMQPSVNLISPVQNSTLPMGEVAAHAGRMTDVPYTHGHHESVLRSHRWRTAANSAGYLVDHLRPGQSLLDVGC